MDPFAAYTLYNALRLHFTSESYDYLKYNGLTKNAGTVAAHRKFLANKQKVFYTQLSRHADPEGLVLANLLVNPKAFITDIVGPDGLEHYTLWKARQGRLTHLLREELGRDNSWRRMVALDTNGLPFLVNEFIGGRVSPETIVIVDAFSKRLDEWAKIPHPLMGQVQLKLRKYRPFVNFDKGRAKAVLQELAGAK